MDKEPKPLPKRKWLINIWRKVVTSPMANKNKLIQN